MDTLPAGELTVVRVGLVVLATHRIVDGLAQTPVGYVGTLAVRRLLDPASTVTERSSRTCYNQVKDDP